MRNAKERRNYAGGEGEKKTVGRSGKVLFKVVESLGGIGESETRIKRMMFPGWLSVDRKEVEEIKQMIIAP